MSDWDAPDTLEATVHTQAGAQLVRRFSLVAVEGDFAGLTHEAARASCQIGSHPANDFCVEDPTVSRFHCEVVLDESGARVRDLGSLNGTSVDGVRLEAGWLKDGSHLRVGHTVLRFELRPGRNRVVLSEKDRFGPLVGISAPMRAIFAVLEKVCASDVQLLIEGETGVGKTAAALAVHEAGPRSAGELVVVDCGALPRALLESELFGHERGSFTGADRERPGAFELADGGTLLLDGVDELPLEVQATFLRALEEGEVRRVGSSEVRHVDVRTIATSHRDLRVEVSRGAFREDLYFRLAVVRVVIPPLRQRTEDIVPTARALLRRLGLSPDEIRELTSGELRDQLRRGAWRGNVRELSNFLERRLVLDGLEPPVPAEAGGPVVDAALPYDEARRRALDAFERAYAIEVLALHDGNLTKAAREAGIARSYLYRLLDRHGIPR